jgi:hypothetical protein
VHEHHLERCLMRHRELGGPFDRLVAIDRQIGDR